MNKLSLTPVIDFTKRLVKKYHTQLIDAMFITILAVVGVIVFILSGFLVHVAILLFLLGWAFLH